MGAHAAGICILLTVAWWQFPFSSGRQFQTNIGEQRTFELTDGSIVKLNASSRLTVDLSDEAREIHLHTGEALFKVARETARPFRVSVDKNVIHTAGTQFNVNRRQSGTTVSVIEGRVRTSPVSSTQTPDERQISASAKKSAYLPVTVPSPATRWT